MKSARQARSAEQMLWLAGYVVLVLAPLALLAVAIKPGAQGPGVILAAGLGFTGLSILVLQGVVSGRWASITAAFGLRSVLSLHRQAGMAALVLVVGHVVVLMVDDPSRLALLDQRDAPLRARAALAATLAMLVLAASSVWRGRLRMSYERWRAVHVVGATVVVAGSFIHVVGVSAYASLAGFRWGVLFLVLLGIGALFCIRVARPYALSRRAFRVRRVARERGSAVTVELEAERGRGLRFQPGEFAWLKTAHRPYGMDEHPFSFSSSVDRPDRPAFTVKAIGDFTEALESIPLGTPVLIDGPHGEGIPDDGSGCLLVVAGIGITPAMSMLRTAADRGDDRPLMLIYGNRYWEDVTFREELAELERKLPSLRVIHVLSRPHEEWDGETGRVDASLLDRVVPDAARDWTALICGPAQMVAGTSVALRALGLPAGAIHVEGFG